MVTGVSASNAAYSPSIAEQAIQNPTPAAQSLPQDTVTLSSAAQRVSAAGNGDHDGDSH